VPERDFDCPCGEHSYTVSFTRKNKKDEPMYCPFCGAEAEEEKIEELELDEDE